MFTKYFFGRYAVLKRKIWEYLCEWKKQPRKKALLITGARQIGKTYIIRCFGREKYKYFIEINFIESPAASGIFRDVSDVNMIVANITAFTGKSLEPGSTLIFFDEIQECPQARTAIKFLVEDGRFDYIESGSLLGVNYKEVQSYPVGFEDTCHMYPMDLEEFLWANKVKPETIHYLRDCYEHCAAVSDSIHNTMLQLFRYYMIVGGMPAVVQCFATTHDLGKVIELQRSILELYRQDITKYSRTDKAKIRDIFDRIPSELNEKNKRFILASIQKSSRMERYKDCFAWLADAGVSLPCYNVTEPKIPLKINEKHNLFKLFLVDTGLLCAASLENVQYEILQNRLDINMGSILENMFAQIFHANGFTLRYFDKKNRGEVDFILQKGKDILPVEIKSGSSYKTHAALNYVLQVEDWNIPQGYVFCPGNIAREKNITYYPLYMAMFFKQEPLRKNWIVEVDLSALDEPS